MSCPTSINTAIDDAISYLQALKALIPLGPPAWSGWHTNPLDGTHETLRTNQILQGDGLSTAITFCVNPATQPETVHSIFIEFNPY